MGSLENIKMPLFLCCEPDLPVACPNKIFEMHWTGVQSMKISSLKRWLVKKIGIDDIDFTFRGQLILSRAPVSFIFKDGDHIIVTAKNQLTRFLFLNIAGRITYVPWLYVKDITVHRLIRRAQRRNPRIVGFHCLSLSSSKTLTDALGDERVVVARVLPDLIYKRQRVAECQGV